MQTKFIPLVSAAALTAALALVTVVAPDDGTEAASADPAPTTTTASDGDAEIIAQAATRPITVPLIERGAELTPAETEKLDAYLAALEEQKLHDYLAAEDQKVRDYLADIARAEAAPAPAPSYAAGSVEDIIARYFGAETSKAISVARCESGLNPGAMSPGGGNHGLFQINSVHSGTWVSVTGTDWSARYDAELNTMFAHWLWSQQGWGPWACA